MENILKRKMKGRIIRATITVAAAEQNRDNR